MIQLLSYSVVGVLNTILGYAVIFACMGWLDWGGVVSNVAGYAVGFVTSFKLNKRFTFRSTGDARRELLRFILVFLLSYFANLIVLVGLTEQFGIDVWWSQLIAGGVYFGCSFMLSKYYVFSERTFGQVRRDD